MNRNRLASIASAIAQEPLGVSTASVRVIYWFEEQWHDVTSKSTETRHAAALSALRDGALAWSKPSRRHVLFRLPTFDAAVSVNFSRAPTDNRIISVEKQLGDLIRRHDDAFHANHDALTGCLNRRAFETALREKLEKVDLQPPPATSAALINSNVYLVSLDIDHFKQINDTFGHQYGDTVLRAFAWRVTDICEQAQAESNGRYSVEMSRPGGEEFQIILHGFCSEQIAVELAERVRTGIQSQPLPSEHELSTLNRDGLASGNPPDPGQRRVTVSLGVAGGPCVNKDKVADRAAELVRQADLAVYSSKLGGRNQVRNFSDILNKYGRVLECHGTTGVIAIDIGKEVGVRVGQEFFLIPPDFTGTVDFYAGEGRSRRKAGTYPRLKCGRITIFEVQPEVSFATLNELKPGTSTIPAGTYLEAIPLGYITHLIEGGGESGAFVPSDEIRAAIASPSTAGARVTVIAVGIAQAEKVLSERGSGFVNTLLAKIHGKIRSIVGRQCKIAHIEPANLIVEASGVDLENSIEDIVSTLAEEHDGVNFVGGCFDSALASSVKREFGIECSIAALRASEIKNARWRKFDTGAAIEILNDARKTDHQRGIADYKKFKEMGIRSDEVENTVGLLELESSGGDHAAAEAHFRAAIAMQPDAIYASNLALTLYLQRKVPEAYNEFASVERQYGISSMPQSYLGVYASAAYRAYRVGACEKNEVIRMIELAAAAQEKERQVIIGTGTLGKIRDELAASEATTPKNPGSVKPGPAKQVED